MKAALIAFVLVFATILGATIYVGARLIASAPKDGPYARLDCSFDSYCDGTDCTLPLPAAFQITPNGRFDRPYLHMEGRRTSTYSRTEGDARAYINSANGIGVVTIRVHGDYSMTYEKQRGDGDETIVATGTGRCRPESTA